MIINRDHKGRTQSGKITYRPLIQFEPDDFPPDSLYWGKSACAAQKALADQVGAKKYNAWRKIVWPGDTIYEFTWRQLYKAFQAALTLATIHRERNIRLLAKAAISALAASESSPSHPA